MVADSRITNCLSDLARAKWKREAEREVETAGKREEAAMLAGAGEAVVIGEEAVKEEEAVIEEEALEEGEVQDQAEEVPVQVGATEADSAADGVAVMTGAATARIRRKRGPLKFSIHRAWDLITRREAAAPAPASLEV